MDHLMECKNLTKRFGKRTAVSQMNLQLGSGHIVGLLGPNGSGKTTLIKMMNGLLVPSEGNITFCGEQVGVESKKHISYLPDQTYLNMNQKVKDVVIFFQDFYEDFDTDRAYDMLRKLQIDPNDELKTLSKGTKEKVQLILVMSRLAKLYILDEPIAGVDIENVLDEVVFIKEGRILLHSSVEDIRGEQGMSIDAYFREVFKC